MVGDSVAHGGALMQLHTGTNTFTRPSWGSWVVYGLGTENQNLPGFITIKPTLFHGGAKNYSAGFLPAAYEGTAIGYAALGPDDLKEPIQIPRESRPHARTAAFRARDARQDQPPQRRAGPLRPAARGEDPGFRVSGAHADRSARGVRYCEGVRSHQEALRAGRRRVARLRLAVSGGAAAVGAWRALRTGLAYVSRGQTRLGGTPTRSSFPTTWAGPSRSINRSPGC